MTDSTESAAASRRISLAFGGLTAFAESVVFRDVSQAPDLAVQGPIDLDDPAWLDSDAMLVDVALIGVPDAEDGLFAEILLAARPRLRVLQLGTDGANCVLYELRPQRTRLGELSPNELVETIRCLVAEQGFANLGDLPEEPA